MMTFEQWVQGRAWCNEMDPDHQVRGFVYPDGSWIELCKNADCAWCWIMEIVLMAGELALGLVVLVIFVLVLVACYNIGIGAGR